jgi:hypothetical protein
MSALIAQQEAEAMEDMKAGIKTAIRALQVGNISSAISILELMLVEDVEQPHLSEFPKYVHHPDGKTKPIIVQDAEHEQRVLDSWADYEPELEIGPKDSVPVSKETSVAKEDPIRKEDRSSGRGAETKAGVRK